MFQTLPFNPYDWIFKSLVTNSSVDMKIRIMVQELLDKSYRNKYQKISDTYNHLFCFGLNFCNLLWL